MTYIVRLLIALDQLGNAVLLGNPDETISSRVGRHAVAGKRWALACEWIIDRLFFALTGEWNHCRANIEWDEA